MAGSVMVAVKRAVIDGFKAHLKQVAEYATVEVDYGYSTALAAHEAVFCGRGSSDTPPAAIRAGRNHRDEDGEFIVAVIAKALGGTQLDADERAFGIGGELETWLADRKSNELHVPGLQSIGVAGFEMAPMYADTGHLTEVEYRVTYRARLT